MQQIEIEYKTLLSREEFDQLTAKFSDIPVVSQTNHYFDTADFALRKAKLSLRIRTLSNRAELTLKIPQTVGNIEHNLDLTLEDAKRMISTNRLEENKVTHLLQQDGFHLDNIQKVGDLTTHRREARLPIGLMALDENHYSGIVDYELELEVTDSKQGQKDFDHFLAQENIRFKYAKSKVARFVSTLKNKLP
ncbi:CYTH domain-containing protein [Streptococcus merionis]|uniref:CYTH domain-containing protein n=1 Tax=Streptococcus merionis TaxID=400065 RepID=UPI003518FEBA